MALPNVTYMDQYIRDGTNAIISLRKIYDSLLMAEEGKFENMCRIPLYDVFTKHRTQFEDPEGIRFFNMSESYNYKPKALSLELYGTTEMWLALLRLNRMRNVTEFTRRDIRIYTPDRAKLLLDIIFKRENR